MVNAIINIKRTSRKLRALSGVIRDAGAECKLKGPRMERVAQTAIVAMLLLVIMNAGLGIDTESSFLYAVLAVVPSFFFVNCMHDQYALFLEQEKKEGKKNE